MTKLEQAARQALEVIELMYEWLNAGTPSYVDESKEEAITALREALDHIPDATKMVQEPVLRYAHIKCPVCDVENPGIHKCAAPVRTKDLTEAEIDEIWKKHSGGNLGFAYAVIAAYKEKNK